MRDSLDAYLRQAETLYEALQSGDETAAWRFKWEHPRFRDQTIVDVRNAALNLSDAQTVIARQNAFETWDDLRAFLEAHDATFEAAVDAAVSGDVAKLSALLAEHPDLVRRRSARRHHATLLHYLAANGVEDDRQKTPANAVEIAKMLLDAGADANALADMYGDRYTTMSMLVSSSHPHDAGLQVPLAELLLDHGAEPDILMALAFGYRDTAEALARRGAPLDLAAVAGLGRIDDIARLLPDADARTRHIALSLAAHHGQTAVVRLLLDAGEDPNRFHPKGYHAHSTPLHSAAFGNHLDLARLLVERGARTDIRDTIYSATPLGWAEYGGQAEVAEYLRGVTPSDRS